MILRAFTQNLHSRLIEKSPLVQVILGPCQVGKTTGVLQLIDTLKQEYGPICHYATADESLAPSPHWLLEHWERAKALGPGAVLIVDEVQKVSQWSSAVKMAWDKQQRPGSAETKIKCVLLGSSSLALQKGLTESLTGRFELIPVSHWDYQESKVAFGFDLPTFLTYGGYPGGTQYLGDYSRWYSYIKNSIVETVIGKDILGLQSVRNPALFRQTFELLCNYPGQIISYTKLLGQLQEKGNTDLIQHYIELYEGAFLFKALKKFSNNSLRKKTSSPKGLPLCPAFYTLTQGPEAIKSHDILGRLFECAVGADLNRLPGELYYWREGNFEVDYVYKFGSQVVGVEVKTGTFNDRHVGIEHFKKVFPHSKALILKLEDYELFSKNPSNYLDQFSF